MKNYSDEKLEKMRRGGHDPEKVYAAYKKATEINNGLPTVILAKTVKGYGLGEAGEGRNVAHNQKKLNEAELLEFRTRFGIPISDAEVGNAPFYKPPESSQEIKYLKKRRAELGGYVPSRPIEHPTLEVPSLDDYREKHTKGSNGKEMSTTMAFVRLLQDLVRDDKIVATSCRLCPMNRARSVWKACSARSAYTLTQVNCTSQSIRTSCRTTRKPKTVRSWKKDYRMRLDQLIRRCRHGL